MKTAHLGGVTEGVSDSKTHEGQKRQRFSNHVLYGQIRSYAIDNVIPRT